MDDVLDSVARLERSKILADYFSWPVKSIQTLAELAAQAGKGATIREYEGLSKEGTLERFFVVYEPDGESCGIINESHPCPPICPE